MHCLWDAEALMTTTNTANGSSERHDGASTHAGATITRGLGSLPKRVRTQFRDNPASVVAAVGAGSFVLGALVASRVGRIALAAAIPLALERLFKGAVGDKLVEYVKALGSEAEGG